MPRMKPMTQGPKGTTIEEQLARKHDARLAAQPDAPTPEALQTPASVPTEAPTQARAVPAPMPSPTAAPAAAPRTTPSATDLPKPQARAMPSSSPTAEPPVFPAATALPDVTANPDAMARQWDSRDRTHYDLATNTLTVETPALPLGLEEPERYKLAFHYALFDAWNGGDADLLQRTSADLIADFYVKEPQLYAAMTSGAFSQEEMKDFCDAMRLTVYLSENLGRLSSLSTEELTEEHDALAMHSQLAQRCMERGTELNRGAHIAHRLNTLTDHYMTVLAENYWRGIDLNGYTEPAQAPAERPALNGGAYEASFRSLIPSMSREELDDYIDAIDRYEKEPTLLYSVFLGDGRVPGDEGAFFKEHIRPLRADLDAARTQRLTQPNPQPWPEDNLASALLQATGQHNQMQDLLFDTFSTSRALRWQPYPAAEAALQENAMLRAALADQRVDTYARREDAMADYLYPQAEATLQQMMQKQPSTSEVLDAMLHWMGSGSDTSMLQTMTLGDLGISGNSARAMDQSLLRGLYALYPQLKPLVPNLTALNGKLDNTRLSEAGLALGVGEGSAAFLHGILSFTHHGRGDLRPAPLGSAEAAAQAESPVDLPPLAQGLLTYERSNQDLMELARLFTDGENRTFFHLPRYALRTLLDQSMPLALGAVSPIGAAAVGLTTSVVGAHDEALRDGAQADEAVGVAALRAMPDAVEALTQEGLAHSAAGAYGKARDIADVLTGYAQDMREPTQVIAYQPVDDDPFTQALLAKYPTAHAMLGLARGEALYGQAFHAALLRVSAMGGEHSAQAYPLLLAAAAMPAQSQTAQLFEQLIGSNTVTLYLAAQQDDATAFAAQERPRFEQALDTLSHALRAELDDPDIRHDVYQQIHQAAIAQELVQLAADPAWCDQLKAGCDTVRKARAELAQTEGHAQQCAQALWQAQSSADRIAQTAMETGWRAGQARAYGKWMTLATQAHQDDEDARAVLASAMARNEQAQKQGRTTVQALRGEAAQRVEATLAALQVQAKPGRRTRSTSATEPPITDAQRAALTQAAAALPPELQERAHALIAQAEAGEVDAGILAQAMVLLREDAQGQGHASLPLAPAGGLGMLGAPDIPWGAAGGQSLPGDEILYEGVPMVDGAQALQI